MLAAAVLSSGTYCRTLPRKDRDRSAEVEKHGHSRIVHDRVWVAVALVATSDATWS
jgi:hypothetical protein